MIYLKINKKVYTDINTLIKDNGFNIGYKTAIKYAIFKRIISRNLSGLLSKFPDIDIVISNKDNKQFLGRFYTNKLKYHAEYKFIPQSSGKPYIVLFEKNILDYFKNNPLKGFKEVFLHEVYHYNQLLNHEPLKHNNIIHAVDNPKTVDHNLKVISEALSKRG